MALSIYVRTAPVGSGAASDGNLFTGIAWRWRGLRCYAFPLYCTNPIHPSLGHGQMKLGEWKPRFHIVWSAPAGSSAASDGNLFSGIAWRWRGRRCCRVPTVLHQSKTPLPGSLANSAELFLQVHSPPGVAWPPMVTLSLGNHGFGVGDAAVAPHCLVLSRLPGNGKAKLGLRAIEPSPSACG